MRIAFWGKNSDKSYSGGRIHAWMMAEALAANGHRVTYFTNNIPVFYDEYKDYPGHNKIDVQLDELFRVREGKSDFYLIVWVPHLRSLKSTLTDRLFFYNNLKKLKRYNDCPIIKIDFESPNWIIEVLPQTRNLNDYKYQLGFLSNIGGVLSSTKIGMTYAKKFYNRYKPDLNYAYCYPPINSKCADIINVENKQRKITIITRFTDAHKNPVDIHKILPEALNGFIINIIFGRGGIQENIKRKISERAAEINCKVRYLSKITEEQKYRELKTSQALLFFTKFEGFGLPPVEAQYCGTKVICTDLQVLREVNKQNVIFIKNTNTKSIRNEITKVVNESYNSDQIKKSIYNIGNFDCYRKRLDDAIDRLIAIIE